MSYGLYYGFSVSILIEKHGITTDGLECLWELTVSKAFISVLEAASEILLVPQLIKLTRNSQKMWKTVSNFQIPLVQAFDFIDGAIFL